MLAATLRTLIETWGLRAVTFMSISFTFVDTNISRDFTFVKAYVGLQPAARTRRIRQHMLIRRLALLALLLSTACAHQQRPAALPGIDAAIEKELANGIPSAAVAIAKNGVIVHEAAFGFADANRRATVNTPYPLASLTKPFVATGIMLLAARGK